MRPCRAVAAMLVAAAFAAADARAQGGVPEVIKARVNALVTACASAGGQLGQMTGQGQFVIPHDFNSDGRTDFLVSEGNFPCAGRPELFRRNGQARVELYLGDGAGAAVPAFADDLTAYRVVDGRPVKLQIARKGTGCGAGSDAASQCGAELRWNPGGKRFDEVATGSRGAGKQAAVRPAVIVPGPGVSPAAVAPAASPAATAPTAAAATPAPATAAGPAAAPLALKPGARDEFLAKCRRDTLAKYPQMNVANADDSCTYGWDKVAAAGPVADALLAAAPTRAGERLTAADLRARLPKVRWSAQPSAGRGQGNSIATGKLGELEVSATGGTQADEISLGWSEVGGDPPYDAAAALAARGAKVTALGCYHYGAGESNKVHIIEAPGRAPFALTTYSRGAPTGSAHAFQNISADLTGKLPTLTALRAEHRDPEWQASCPF